MCAALLFSCNILPKTINYSQPWKKNCEISSGVLRCKNSLSWKQVWRVLFLTCNLILLQCLLIRTCAIKGNKRKLRLIVGRFPVNVGLVSYKCGSYPL